MIYRYSISVFSDYFDSFSDRFDWSLYVLIWSNNMPRIISPDEKLAVIRGWLDGETRENIAINHNIGSGTVYNIVYEWSNKFGIEKTNVLREIAIQ